VDISRLRSGTGHITLDSGYGNTGSCTSGITFIDGEKGILRYRGYPIEQLAASCDFLDVAHLLIYGELPTGERKSRFTSAVTNHTLIHEEMKKFFEGYPPSAHPMAILASMFTSLSTFYPDGEDVDLDIIRLIAKAPTIAAFSYKKSVGQPFVYPRNDLSYSANFLNMMFRTPAEDYEVPESVRTALNLLLILHADHEQNCSTSTVRMVGSSQANLFASMAAGVTALWGPLHGGANQKVIEMLQRIADDGGDYAKYTEMAKDRDSGFRLMGFGHRVYKNFDPRARILKSAADQVLSDLGVEDPLLDIAKNLEEIPDRDVHGHVRARAPARLDRAVEGDARRPQGSHLPAAAGLRGADRAPPRLIAERTRRHRGLRCDAATGCTHRIWRMDG
jgi:citrate synthase